MNFLDFKTEDKNEIIIMRMFGNVMFDTGNSTNK